MKKTVDKRKNLIFIFSFAIFMAFSFVLFSQHNVFADGVIGPGDPGGDLPPGATDCLSQSGAWSCKGWGWYSYPVSGGIRPYRFRNGETWANASSQCMNIGADRVIAFIVLREYGIDASTGVVYTYDLTWGGSKYNGEVGGDWLPTATAKEYYDNMDANKVGFTWGSNVAWFCHSSNPTWTISAESTIASGTTNESGTLVALPGSIVNWAHTVSNTGANTNQPVASSITKSITTISTGSVANVTGLEPGSTPAGTAPGVIRSINGPGESGASHTVTQSDVGKIICEWVVFRPIDNKTDTEGYATFNNNCVTIPYRWTISVDSRAVNSRNEDIDTAYPGDRVYWNHSVTNDGPTITNTATSYRYQNGDSLGTGYGSAASTTFSYPGSASFTSFHDVTQNDVGKFICRSTQATPASSGNPGPVSSTCDRVIVPYNYNLVPSLSNSSATVIEEGVTIVLVPSIDNRGRTKSESAEWRLTKSVSSVNGGAESNVASASGIIFPTGITRLSDYIDDGTTFSAGTEICFRLYVRPVTQTNSNWSNPSQVCIKIGKKPKIQIWGGNLVSGLNVTTSTSRKIIDGTSRLFGSWAEYGILAPGTITNMASTSAFNLGLAGSPTTINACSYSHLSFANTPLNGSSCTSSGLIGDYRFNYPDRDIAESFSNKKPISSSSLSANELLDASGMFFGERNGNLTLNASTLAKGKSVILKVNGDVTIVGDQYYENVEYTSALQLPQLIILANNINITSNVVNIDAWLIAKDGIINTCSDVTGNLKIDTCSNLLTVNGPVVGKTLKLRRTAGSGTGDASDDPAEIFNLRADAILWSAAQANTRNIIQSVYTSELPPRF